MRAVSTVCTLCNIVRSSVYWRCKNKRANGLDARTGVKQILMVFFLAPASTFFFMKTELEASAKNILRAVFDQTIKALVPSSFGDLPARANKMADVQVS